MSFRPRPPPGLPWTPTRLSGGGRNLHRSIMVFPWEIPRTATARRGAGLSGSAVGGAPQKCPVSVHTIGQPAIETWNDIDAPGTYVHRN